MTDASEKLLSLVPIAITAKLVKGFIPELDKKGKKTKSIFED